MLCDDAPRARPCRPEPDAHEEMRGLGVAVAVVELGDAALSETLAEPQEAAGALRDGHGEQRLACVADLGALGDVPQPIEIQVGAAS